MLQIHRSSSGRCGNPVLAEQFGVVNREILCRFCYYGRDETGFNDRESERWEGWKWWLFLWAMLNASFGMGIMLANQEDWLWWGIFESICGNDSQHNKDVRISPWGYRFMTDIIMLNMTNKSRGIRKLERSFFIVNSKPLNSKILNSRDSCNFSIDESLILYNYCRIPHTFKLIDLKEY